jgi:hypothetical protein
MMIKTEEEEERRRRIRKQSSILPFLSPFSLFESLSSCTLPWGSILHNGFEQRAC